MLDFNLNLYVLLHDLLWDLIFFENLISNCLIFIIFNFTYLGAIRMLYTCIHRSETGVKDIINPIYAFVFYVQHRTALRSRGFSQVA